MEVVLDRAAHRIPVHVCIPRVYVHDAGIVGQSVAWVIRKIGGHSSGMNDWTKTALAN